MIDNNQTTTAIPTGGQRVAHCMVATSPGQCSFSFSGNSMGYFLLGLLLVWVTLVWAEAGFRPAPAGRKWLKEPGNPVRLATWVIAIAVVALAFLSPTDTLLGGLRSEAISTAFAVIVINELGIYRAALQEKRSIIEQLGSPVNDAALEALRLATKNGWLKDGTMNGANLRGANLTGARLREANLTGADLGDANLTGTDLISANLTHADLMGANLDGTNLMLANLTHAVLLGANLTDANLMFANLTSADLLLANLTGANLMVANLTHANLSSANLTGAKLWLADLTLADLTHAKLSSADIEGAKLSSAKYDIHTIWPDNFAPVQAGARLVGE